MVDHQKRGGPWRMRPQDFGHGHSVYGDFKRWRAGGLWGALMKALRQREGDRQGRTPEPWAVALTLRASERRRHPKQTWVLMAISACKGANDTSYPSDR